jgi:hypothetical protein
MGVALSEHADLQWGLRSVPQVALDGMTVCFSPFPFRF